MTRIFVLICFLASSNMALAQKDSLSVDDHGKYIYYKVVIPGISSPGALYARATAYLQSHDKNTLKPASHDAQAMSLCADGYIMVSKSGSLSKHYDGRISCKLNIEVKDAKYRYWFTDFVYTPYQRDRYNNYVPQNGMDIALEKADKLIGKKDHDHYLDECARFSKQTGETLQLAMAATPIVKKDTVARKVISINKW